MGLRSWGTLHFLFEFSAQVVEPLAAVLSAHPCFAVGPRVDVTGTPIFGVNPMMLW
jgi:hypothetical protein